MLTTIDLPYHEPRIFSPAHQQRAIRAEGEGWDSRIAMSSDTPEALLAGMVPELDHAIDMATGQQLSIRAKGH